MTDETKKEVAEAAVKLAEYIHSNNFEGLIMSGGSNQLSRSLLTLAWQHRYKGEPMPQLYVFDAKANDMLYKSEVDTSILKPEILDWISVNLPELKQIKDHSLCYVDDFAITGGKYVALKKRFEQLDFKDLKFAFFGATSITELGKDTFAGTLDLETTRELLDLSLQIQGRPAHHEILEDIVKTAESHRLGALSSLRDVGQTIRRK